MLENQTELETEIQAIEEDLASKRARLEEQKRTGEVSEIAHDSEILRRTIGEKFNIPSASGPEEVEPIPEVKPQTKQPVSSEPPSYLSQELRDVVQKLVETVFKERGSIAKAAREAIGLNNPAALDAFHDAIVDGLIPELIKRGKIREVK